MAVSSDELWNSAQLFKQHASNEADYRGCISRAYYACFHASQNFHKSLSSQGIPKSDCGLHEKLIHMLTNPTTTINEEKVRSETIGYMLKNLKRKRTDADYKLQKAPTHRDLEIVFEESKVLLEEISK